MRIATVSSVNKVMGDTPEGGASEAVYVSVPQAVEPIEEV